MDIPAHAHAPASDFRHVVQMDIGCDDCAVRLACQGARLKHDVPDHVYNQLFHTRVIKAKQYLFHAGDDLEALFVIKSGSFKTCMIFESGDEYVTGFPMAGDVVGTDALARRKHEFSTIALVDSVVCIAPIKMLESTVHHYSSDWLVRQACQASVYASYKFLSTRNNAGVYAKVAAFLIDQSNSHKERGCSGEKFRLHMTRADIANYLGCKMETVSRALHHLKDNKILGVNGRCIAIKDFRKLQRFTEMHEPQQPSFHLNKSSGDHCLSL